MAETLTDEGRKLRETGRKWIERIDAAYQLEKTFFTDAEKATAVYAGERTSASSSDNTWSTRYDFNILYSNVETIVPAIINSPPSPDIRRRFNDTDPVAKDLAELLERAIRVQVDDSRLQTEMEKSGHDAFLAGRGIIRLRFKSEDTYNYEELKDDAEDESEGGDDSDDAEDDEDESSEPTGERICFEAVSWRDYRHGPAKRWEDRPWEAFRHAIPMEDLETFADSAVYSSQAVPEDQLDRGETDNDVIVWEVWHRKAKNVLFIEENTGKVLKKVDDPLGLSSFFPTATPIQPIEINGRLMPVNPFAIYRKLAEELDIVTRRIYVITDQMRVRGWYPGSATDLQNMLEAGDTDFVPIADAEMWAQNGGLQNAVAFWPIEKFAVALRELYVSRDQTKQAIYEITGISDIIRGASMASETATAQSIKSQWGNLRIQKAQRMMERAARDLFVMMAEIIPEKFSNKTLQDMTGIELIASPEMMQPLPPPQIPQPQPGMPPEQAQQMQQQAQQAMGEYEKAEKARLAKLEHIAALNTLMKEKLQSFYRIDVESDSTVRADLTRQKQEVAEFLQGAGAYFASVGPLVQEGALSPEVAMEIFASNARMFNLGKSVEDAIDKTLVDAKALSQQPKQEKPNPDMIKAQLEEKKVQGQAQIAQAKAQSDQANAQMQMQAVQAKTQGEMAKLQADLQAQQMEAQLQAQTLQAKMVADQQSHDMEMQKGQLELVKIQAEIEKIRAGTASTLITSQAKTELAERNQSFKETQATKEPAE